MYRKFSPRLSALAAIALTLFLGCATSAKVVGTGLSKDATYFWLGSSASEAVSIFSTEDEKVTLRVKFAPNLVGWNWIFKVEWIGPSGEIYLQEPVKTKYGNNEILFAELPIANHEPSKMTGRWRVKLFDGEIELVNRSFTIE